MKSNQKGWLREFSFGKLLVLVAVFVAALTGLLALTDPSNAGRTAVQDPQASEARIADTKAQSLSGDPSLPAAADVLKQPAPSEAPAPTF